VCSIGMFWRDVNNTTDIPFSSGLIAIKMTFSLELIFCWWRGVALIIGTPAFTNYKTNCSITICVELEMMSSYFPYSPIKSSRAHSRVNWLQVQTDVSGTISVPIIRVVMSSQSWWWGCHHNPDDGDRDSSRNVGSYLQPIDAAVCPRRFYWI
jgi:hypothetical protein